MSEYVYDYEIHRQAHADCPRDDEGNDSLHVECDDKDCWVLIHPETVDEFRLALEHWRDHGWFGGCSHGG